MGERGDLKLRDRSRRGMQRKEENKLTRSAIIMTVPQHRLDSTSSVCGAKLFFRCKLFALRPDTKWLTICNRGWMG
jgi:hypothetical protein